MRDHGLHLRMPGCLGKACFRRFVLVVPGARRRLRRGVSTFVCVSWGVDRWDVFFGAVRSRVGSRFPKCRRGVACPWPTVRDPSLWVALFVEVLFRHQGIPSHLRERGNEERFLATVVSRPLIALAPAEAGGARLHVLSSPEVPSAQRRTQHVAMICHNSGRRLSRPSSGKSMRPEFMAPHNVCTQLGWAGVMFHGWFLDTVGHTISHHMFFVGLLSEGVPQPDRVRRRVTYRLQETLRAVRSQSRVVAASFAQSCRHVCVRSDWLARLPSRTALARASHSRSCCSRFGMLRPLPPNRL